MSEDDAPTGIPTGIPLEIRPSSVSLESVSKDYGSVHAVRELSLDARPGEFLVLLGPSGCGKSTVLRLVAGLETPTSGVIRIGDKVVNDLEPRDRDVAMVFQSYALYPHLNVRRNIDFPLREHHVPASERDTLVEEVARVLQLDEFLGRKPAALSGGQRQRVALARAMVRRPHVFLMDEPLSNLDAQLRVEMRAELVELQARLGVTVLYVTHDQVEAMTMGARIAVLKDGELQQVAEPALLHDRPANAFVAGFVGSPPMNILSGSLDRDEEGVAITLPGGRIPLPPQLTAALRTVGLDEVVVGLRAEDLRIDPHGSLSATVSLVESVGRDRHVACRLHTGQLVTVRLNRDATMVRTGEAVMLSVGGMPHLFHPTTKARIDL